MNSSFKKTIHGLCADEINIKCNEDFNDMCLIRALKCFQDNDFIKFSNKVHSIAQKRNNGAEMILLNNEIIFSIKQIFTNYREIENYQSVLILLLRAISKLWHRKSLFDKNIYRKDIFKRIIMFLPTDFSNEYMYIETLTCICYFIQSEENATFLIEKGTINLLTLFIQANDLGYSTLLICFFNLLSRLYKYLLRRNYYIIYDFTFFFIAKTFDLVFYSLIECKRLLKIISYIVQEKQGYTRLKSTSFFDYFFTICEIFKCDIVKFSAIILNQIIKYDNGAVPNIEKLYNSCAYLIQNEMHFLHWLKNWPYLCRFLRTSIKFYCKAVFDAGLVDLMKQMFYDDHNYILKIESISCYCAYLIYVTNDDFLKEIANMNLHMFLEFLEDDPLNRSSKWILKVFIRMIKLGEMDNNLANDLNHLFLEMENQYLHNQKIDNMIQYIKIKFKNIY
ncbi:hypothetical protein TRFO_18469 [Tritrichomonas foetus]|uniref:Uncharacterized protein n=1 Tax=Tritrichomonas foetus TaxID=1144522 RepID=A0A1J4KKS6_9EUKA|nr:hypothetical protein TRFO_18469 [Tritrichomonas foetus]|eukprot:OHT11895.1 hypothetical protein TRFO_18469 [Tritrichomonas foetus]